MLLKYKNKLAKFFILTIGCLQWYNSSLAQSPSLSSSEILLGLQKVNTIGSVLYIAAHPDDENTRLLSYLANERKLRAGYLSITRGDGGQNLIGSEQGELLGLIRTQELLAARKKDGAEQFFTRANDFGYSKTPEETFAIWNKDSILADIVWVIRKFKPDVIICRFPTTGEGGHGHHTASAILAEEAFDAAADEKRFPDQLKHVSIWKTKRLFWNTFNFGATNTTAPEQLKIDVGIYNPLLGKGYGEIAAESRSMHKSQGFGSAKGRGTTLEYFKVLKGDSAKIDLFDGIDLTWKRFPEASKFETSMSEIIKKYDVSDPSKSVTDLVNAYKEIYSIIVTKNNSPIQYWREQKLKELQNLILHCAGVWIEAYAQSPIGVPGNKYAYSIQCIKRSNANVVLNKINFFGQFDTIANLNLKNNELITLRHKEKLSITQPYSNPYWLEEKHPTGIYTVKDQLLIGTPENISTTQVYFQILIEGINFQVIRPIVIKTTDPVKGEIYRPYEVLPPVTLNLSEKTYVSSEGKTVSIKVTVKASKDSVVGIVVFKSPINWISHSDNNSFELNKKDEEKIIEFTLTPNNKATDSTISVYALIGEKYFNHSLARINYDHIPQQIILNKAESKLVKIDLKKTGKNIGYIPGAGDEVANCLRQIGYTVTELSNDNLKNDNLSKYDAIVTGVRAYNTNEQLSLHHKKLMEYVSNGGNYIVQYNTNNNFGKLNASIGPYPFTVSRERVTDENAKVEFDRKTHPIYIGPNALSSKDFDNWIQERGIYFVTDKDDKYETIFSMNDKDEKPLKGSLIYAHYGKGNFVYTGLAFFRQLPAGVPGAYRLFVNLLSLPKTK